MSNCRITPVLVLVLVFSFMFGGCGRDMDLRELSQDQVPAGAGEEDDAGEGAAGEAEAFPGAGGSGGEDVSGEAECVIHICGAVAVPGVYRLPAGSRVVDAVEAAGGLAEDAAERGVNQAAPISDGMQIVIPTLEEAEQGNFFRRTGYGGKWIRKGRPCGYQHRGCGGADDTAGNRSDKG